VHKVIDGDGHIFEWDRTFADEYLDAEFRHRKPVVVDGPQQLHWLVDNVAYPGLYGADRFGFEGSPVSRGDLRRDTIVPKRESLDVLEIRDPAERLALHRAEGIDAAVIYPTLFLVRPLSRDARFEAALCRSYNNWMADLCGRAGATLEWVAVVDFHDPAAAAGEIGRAKELGAVGVMAPGMVDTESIAAPRFDPIWAAAEQHDLGVGVHVAYCTPLDTFTFVFSVLMGCEQVMASGLLDRHPGLRVAFLETSCNWVPFLVERLEEKANPERRRFKPDRPLDTVVDRPEQGGYHAELSPQEYIDRGNVFFGFEVEDPLLPYCVEHFGEDCWLFGSDIPHGDRLANAAKVLQERSDLKDDVKRKMLLDNVARFYRLAAD
jgi:predicted TIM-barrel fold metal-dependent hydrolase